MEIGNDVIQSNIENIEAQVSKAVDEKVDSKEIEESKSAEIAKTEEIKCQQPVKLSGGKSGVTKENKDKKAFETNDREGGLFKKRRNRLKIRPVAS